MGQLKQSNRHVTPVFIRDIKPALPKYEVLQPDAAQWLSNAFLSFAPALNSEASSNRRMYERLGKKTEILSRRTVLSDYTHFDHNRWTCYAKDVGHGLPQLDQRMSVFAEAALELARQVYREDDFRRFERAFLVSCTGYDSPSVLQRILPAGWDGQYAMIGHMGCYAAFPAVSLAADCLRSQVQRAHAQSTIFLVELCTLHLDPTAIEVEQQVINMLFADGAVRIDLGLEPSGAIFEFMDRFEFLVPASVELMTWRPSTQNFKMSLSSEVPRKILGIIGDKVDSFLRQWQLTLSDIKQWAIHPGGIKIIEPVAEALGLSPEKIEASLEIYRTRGNMSSATIPHIWHRLANDASQLHSGDFIVSLAFGPGLTVVGNLLRRC